MQTVKHAVICAAGLGSRLEMNMPKCLVEIGGRSIIDYQLELLEDVEDIRIVVGFMEEAVIDAVCKIRNDVTFVRNSDYRSTSNAYSLYLGCHNIKRPFLMLDGDLIIEKRCFDDFLKQCELHEDLVGIAETKTEEAVFVNLDDSEENILQFQRNHKQKYEWCGLAYLSNIKIGEEGKYVFNEFEKHLPLRAKSVKCYEIDTPEDLNYAMNHFNRK